MEAALMRWSNNARQRDIQITGPKLEEKAKDLKKNI